MTACGVQPVCDSRHGRIACKVSLSCTKSKRKENRRLQSNHRALGPTPLLADGGSQSLTRLHRLVCQFRKHSFLVIVALLGHHVPRRFGQLARQRFGGLAVVPAPAILVIPPRKVSRLHKRPRQIFVAAFLVVLPFALTVAQPFGVHQAAVTAEHQISTGADSAKVQ